MLAVILKMKPVNFGSSGSTMRSSAFVGRGDGAILMKQLSSSCTPKLLRAEPKKTGATSAERYVSTLNSGYTPSMSSRSSRNCCASCSPICASSSDELTSTSTFSVTRCLSGLKRSSLCSKMLYTPLNLAPILIGQESGRTLICNSSSNSSSKSNGSRPSRSILLMKMITGVLRIRHTSMSLRVCVSTPFAPSTTMMAESTAVSVR